METLEQRNATLEKEVSAYKNRRKIEKQIELFEVILPCKEYLESRKEYELLKERRQQLHERASELQKRSKPVLDFKEYVLNRFSFPQSFLLNISGQKSDKEERGSQRL